MLTTIKITQRTTVLVTTLSVLCTIGWLAIVWRFGIDFADEGYYWYGCQQLLQGGIPMRDFLAYDIGRYLWGATVMHFASDDGIVGARLSAALFQIATVPVGVWLIVRTMGARFTQLTTIIFAVLVTIILNLWVLPFYKSFDYGVSILILAMLVIMASTLSARSWFGAGIVLGLVAVVGRNHGVYGAFGAFLFILFMAIKLPDFRVLPKPLLAFTVGVVVGFSPNFAMALLVDGFTQAFMTTLRDLIQSGSANIGLPIPWPWVVERADKGWVYYAMNLAQGFAFIALILIPVAAFLALARRKLADYTRIDRLMLSSCCGGLGYAHYAFSRSDLTHLSHSIVGVLLIVLCFGILKARPLIVATLLLLASVLVLVPEKPFLAQFILEKKLKTITVNGIDLRIFKEDARRFAAAENALKSVPRGTVNFLALPNAVGLHAIYKAKMPIWEIYSLSKRSSSFEAIEIARLEAVRPEIILVSDWPLDQVEDQRYSKMHPLTYQWINANYRRAPTAEQWSEMWEVYVPK